LEQEGLHPADPTLTSDLLDEDRLSGGKLTEAPMQIARLLSAVGLAIVAMGGSSWLPALIMVGVGVGVGFAILPMVSPRRHQADREWGRGLAHYDVRREGIQVRFVDDVSGRRETAFQHAIDGLSAKTLASAPLLGAEEAGAAVDTAIDAIRRAGFPEVARALDSRKVDIHIRVGP
jgi:hypothetical protein